jgi:hypothetical protein
MGILMWSGKFTAHTSSLTGVSSSAVESTSSSASLLSVDNSPLTSTSPRGLSPSSSISLANWIEIELICAGILIGCDCLFDVP